ncbi:MAG: polysaccharide deacetylase [Rhizobiales bacterium 62-47]|nr:polysaccharide deacetylase family protein [Hyphomicrobiales bacterium]OJY10443.1 MAG: polysaccharide deacetylase [Rhizobiales bacterium 62-47]
MHALAGKIVMRTLLATFAVAMAATTTASAADCPHEGALGTSRVMQVDVAHFPRVGIKSFPQTLPLQDKEVVLTFDDGPAAQTSQILAALRSECVRATFFMVGKGAQEMPAMVKRIAAAGHTVGHHTWSHRHLNKLSHAAAVEEINRGIAADETALNGVSTTSPSTPFFRFPYFESTPALLDELQSRGIMVFGADLWASDWERMTPDQQLKLLVGRLEVARKGIILLHDPRAQTAAMLPAFLRYLREHGYRVVHIVPAAAGKHS